MKGWSFRSLVAIALAAFATSAHAAANLNEVAAFLVFPSIQVDDDRTGEDDVETFVTITNAGAENIIAHVSFINGDESDPNYCYECDFNVPLSPNDTETLVFRPNGDWTEIANEDAALVKPEVDGENLTAFGARTCFNRVGMLTVNVEPTDEIGVPAMQNVLLGSEVIVNYSKGYAYSVSAISLDGIGTAPAARTFPFDGGIYAAFPRVVATEFIAPTPDDVIEADLVLFTLNFRRQHPPETDCSMIAYDANEAEFSNSVIFGCWTQLDLCRDFDPEFCAGNLGITGFHSHGWLTLSCEVDRDPDDPSVDPAVGNVHGMLIQRGTMGAVPRMNGPIRPGLKTAAAWSRLLYQSVTTGDPGTLELEDEHGPLGDDITF